MNLKKKVELPELRAIQACGSRPSRAHERTSAIKARVCTSYIRKGKTETGARARAPVKTWIIGDRRAGQSSVEE